MVRMTCRPTTCVTAQIVYYTLMWWALHKSFVARTGIMPNRRTADDVGRSLGNKIVSNKRKEGGTGSKGEQLLRRDVPRASDIWNDKLASAKSFVARTGRMPSKYADDDVKRSLRDWIMNNRRKEGGTDSEREQLLRKEVPQFFK